MNDFLHCHAFDLTAAPGLHTFRHPTFGTIRSIILEDERGTPMFIAKDVADALGLADPANTVRRQCKHRKSWRELRVRVGCSVGLHPQTQLIPESDVYLLIMRSRLPSAEQFQAWVTEEVLPAIRKEGRYDASEREGPETGEMSIDEKEILRVLEYMKAKIDRLEAENATQAATIEAALGVLQGFGD